MKWAYGVRSACTKLSNETSSGEIIICIYEENEGWLFTYVFCATFVFLLSYFCVMHHAGASNEAGCQSDGMSSTPTQEANDLNIK